MGGWVGGGGGEGTCAFVEIVWDGIFFMFHVK